MSVLTQGGGRGTVKSISQYEKETIVNFNEDESEATIYTYNKSLLRKLQKFSKEFPEFCKKTGSDEYGMEQYIVRKDRLSINLKKPVSEEQKIALQERARQNLINSNSEL